MLLTNRLSAYREGQGLGPMRKPSQVATCRKLLERRPLAQSSFVTSILTALNQWLQVVSGAGRQRQGH